MMIFFLADIHACLSGPGLPLQCNLRLLQGGSKSRDEQTVHLVLGSWVNEKLRLILRAGSNVDDPTCKFWYLRIYCSFSGGKEMLPADARVYVAGTWETNSQVPWPHHSTPLRAHQLDHSLLIIFTLATPSAHGIRECLQESTSVGKHASQVLPTESSSLQSDPRPPRSGLLSGLGEFIHPHFEHPHQNIHSPCLGGLGKYCAAYRTCADQSVGL